VNPVIVGITISVIALLVTVVNATAGIANFLLSRVRLLGIQAIACLTTLRGNPPRPARQFVVDVVSYGAAIWDLEALIEFTVPDTPGNARRGIVGTSVIGLKPLGPYTNPLNAGQGMTWQMWSDEILVGDFRDQILKRLPHVPRKNISLCIYCSQRRKRLRRIRHPLFHWQLDTFFERKMKVKLTHFLNKYLSWKHRHILRSEGRIANRLFRGWTPPWNRADRFPKEGG
jgi:hypothetical protein